jgi:hypothetical protein
LFLTASRSTCSTGSNYRTNAIFRVRLAAALTILRRHDPIFILDCDGNRHADLFSTAICGRRASELSAMQTLSEETQMLLRLKTEDYDCWLDPGFRSRGAQGVAAPFDVTLMNR